MPKDEATLSAASAGSHGDTLVRALRILARDIYCEDGIATQCIREAADEIERFRLTDEEREAIEDARMCMKAFSEQQWPNDRTAAEWRHHRKTLRGLLKRLT